MTCEKCEFLLKEHANFCKVSERYVGNPKEWDCEKMAKHIGVKPEELEKKKKELKKKEKK